MTDDSLFALKDNVKLYTALGVAKTASETEIKRAYYQLAVLYHPDKNPAGADKFKEISFAYGILSDPEQRRMYDSKTLRNHVEGKARAYDPAMDPNVELSSDQLREFVDRIRSEQKAAENEQRSFEQRRREEMERREKFESQNPHYKGVQIPTTASVLPTVHSTKNRLTADMMKALHEMESKTAERPQTSPLFTCETLQNAAGAGSLKAKMLTEFRQSRKASGISTVADVAPVPTAEVQKKFGIKAEPSYNKAVQHAVQQRANFDYTTFVVRDLVDGGALTEAILADALGEYDPNN